MIRSLALSAILVLGFSASATAQSRLAFLDMRGTPEDQKACGPDAVRLCRHLLDRNDSMVVLQCFLANQTRLSAPCRAVLVKYNQLQ